MKLEYSDEEVNTPKKGKADEENTTGRKSSNGYDSLFAHHDRMCDEAANKLIGEAVIKL